MNSPSDVSGPVSDSKWETRWVISACERREVKLESEWAGCVLTHRYWPPESTRYISSTVNLRLDSSVGLQRRKTGNNGSTAGVVQLKDITCVFTQIFEYFWLTCLWSMPYICRLTVLNLSSTFWRLFCCCFYEVFSVELTGNEWWDKIQIELHPKTKLVIFVFSSDLLTGLFFCRDCVTPFVCGQWTQ